MIDYDRIPPELKAKNNWVATDDKKIPINVKTLMAASSSDFPTWASFDSAYQTVVQWKMFPYMGFVFDGSGYVGIDIDKGYDDGLLNELSCDIINKCKSYTEKSKSGRGVHIIVKGKLPWDGKNNYDGVEIYQTKRFFVMTGDVVCYNKIVENQAAIDYVLEKYFSNIQAPSKGGSGGSGASYKVNFSKGSGKIKIKPEYPEIMEGSRNQSLLSYGGRLINIGYTEDQILNELRKVNAEACNPPLSDREVLQIHRSIVRYKR